ncbi:hypothetical protein IJI72_00610, partial [Candidatus Saccharibacteria bacterium]|nr:hypothetical protein [Candidatus Saccharibacteria bacterium]
PDVSADMFQRRDGFLADCAHVCGNCDNWNSEIFAWDECRICKLSGQMREAGKRCNIRNGEVVRE